MPSLMPNGRQSYQDNNGNPLAGGRIYTYEAGSSTPLATYADTAGATPNPNPVLLNARGEASIWWGDAPYKIVVKDASDVEIYTQDNAQAPVGRADLASSASGKGAALVGFEGSTVADYLKSKTSRVVDTVAALRGLDKTKFTRAFVTGYYAAGDGGGGAYWYDSADTTTADNGGTVIVATDGGRWKLQSNGVLNVRQFGAKGDGTTDDTTAIQAAIDLVNAANGGAIFLPSGTYKVTAALNVTGCDNLVIYGAGDDTSIIRSTSETADVFYDSGTSWFRTFRDFSIESTVTRTAGSYFNLAGERRGLFDRVRITGHFNGFNLAGFEQTELRSCSITKPSGAGTGIVCGAAGAAGQGANLLINSCFIRGQNDVTQTDTLGVYGIAIYDVDAVWAVNTDIGAFVMSDLFIAPNTRSANHFFTQCFFDATKDANCVTMQGAGTKQQISFNGSWFASAGKLAGGSADACGVRALNAGTYQDIQFSGCKFYNSNGTGLLLEMPAADFNVTGCDFIANGASAATNRYGFMWTTGAAGTVGPTISACRFGGGNAPNDVRFDTNTRAYSLVGCNLANGVSNAGANGVFAGNINATDGSVASATTMTVSPTQTYVNVTGNTSIGGITATYPGHVIVLRFNAALNVVDDFANLRLAGNFAAVANSTLTLVCDGAEWREIARANT